MHVAHWSSTPCVLQDVFRWHEQMKTLYIVIFLDMRAPIHVVHVACDTGLWVEHCIKCACCTLVSLGPRPKPTPARILDAIRAGVGLGLGPRLHTGPPYVLACAQTSQATIRIMARYRRLAYDSFQLMHMYTASALRMKCTTSSDENFRFMEEAFWRSLPICSKELCHMHISEKHSDSQHQFYRRIPYFLVKEVCLQFQKSILKLAQSTYAFTPKPADKW